MEFVRRIWFRWLNCWLDRWRAWHTRRLARHTLGRRGEREAARFLRKSGYRLVDRSARGGLGEIDLVAVHDRTVVFIEVKTRRSIARGAPSDAVDREKQRRLTRLALAWLKRHDLLEHPVRFDVVSIVWPNDIDRPLVEHFQGAFEAVGRWQMMS